MSDSYFYIYPSKSLNNCTGDGTVFTTIFDMCHSNVGGDYNIEKNSYIAPRTGLYMFILNFSLSSINLYHNYLTFGLIKDKEKIGVSTVSFLPKELSQIVLSYLEYDTKDNVYILGYNPSQVRPSFGDYTINGTIELSLNCGDSIRSFITLYNGTKSVKIINTNSWFSGRYICK